MLLTGAHDAAAEALITHIERTSQDPVEVLTDATRLSEALEGATVVLLNAGRFATWLNLFRTVVRSRRLVLLLWCTAEDVQTLKLHAQDFFDWVSLTVTVPPHEPSFVLDALATCAQDASVLALHHPPSPPAGFSVVDLRQGYAAIREAIRAGPVWLTGVHAADELLSALVAHAEARPRHGLVLADPGVLEVSIRALDARPAPWAEATERLASLGVSSPGVEAARRALNPTQTLAEAPSPVVVVSNEEWTRLLTRVREERIDDETRRLALALGLVAVERVWREERGWGALGDAAPLGADGVLTAVDVGVAPSVGAQDAARSWFMSAEGLTESQSARLERGLEALAIAERDAMAQEVGRLDAVRATADEIREAGRLEGGAFGERAAALAELITLAASWLPEDDERGARAIETLRRLAAQGALLEAVWADALLRRAMTCLHAPQNHDRRDEAAALLDELGAVNGGERAQAVRAILLGDLDQSRGRWEEAKGHYESAREVSHRLGLWRDDALAAGRIADVLQACGQLEEALRIRMEEELPAFERLGDPRERAVTLGKIADVLHAHGQLDEALRIRNDEMLPIYERVGDVRSRAVTMSKIADLYRIRGQLDEALRILTEEVLPVFDQRGDARAKAIAFGRIADMSQQRGQLDEALRIRWEEEIPVYARIGDMRSKAVTMNKIADVLQMRGQLDEAIRIRTDEVLPVFHQRGDAPAKAITFGKIADVLQMRGQLDEALRIRTDEMLPIYKQLGDRHGIAFTMGRIADVLQARGQLDEALRIRREEELPVYEHFGDVRERAVTLGKIADIIEARGQSEEALRIRRDEVLPVYEQLGDVREKALTMGKIADVFQARGQIDEALRIRREEELPVYEHLGDVRERAVTLGKIADVLQDRGQLDEALRIHREEELPVYERLGDVRSRAVTMSEIARVLQARGQLDDAERILRDEVLPVFEQLGDRQGILASQSRLAITLLLTRKPKRRAEARALLTEALQSAIALKLPVETKHIRATFSRFNLRPPS